MPIACAAVLSVAGGGYHSSPVTRSSVRVPAFLHQHGQDIDRHDTQSVMSASTQNDEDAGRPAAPAAPAAPTVASAGAPVANRPSSDDEDGTSSRKRMRVSRACDSCRRRKERCDGVQPTCGRCTAAGRPCSYNPYRKRGLPTGYVKGTEILLGLLIHSFDEAEDLILSVLSRESSSSAAGGGGHRLPASVSSTSAASTHSLLDRWRKSVALKQLQKSLVAADADEDEESYIQNLNDTLTSAFNALPRRHSTSLNVGGTTPPESNPPDDFPMVDPPSATPLPHSLPPPSLSVPVPTPAVPDVDPAVQVHPRLPPHWSLLVDIYLSQTHSWLPIIQKHTLLRSASLLSGHEGNDWAAAAHGEQPELGDTASLWAALALSSLQLETVQKAGSAFAHEYRAVDINSAEIYVTARDLALKDPTSFSAAHIHAFLILSLVEMTRGQWIKAWLWVGRAVYTATALDIVPSLDDSGSAKPLDDSQKRLFLGCFVLDTLLALKLGYRPYLNTADLQVVGHADANGLEQWETWRMVYRPSSRAGASNPGASGGPGRALGAFNQLSSLAGFLNSLHRLSYSKPSPLEKLHHLLAAFSQQQRTPPTLDSIIGSQGSMNDQACRSPHLLHLRIAAAVTYVAIKARIAKEPPLVLHARPTPDAMPPSLRDTLDFLTTTPLHSPLFGPGWLSPTVGILFDTLQKYGLSTPELPLRPDWSHVVSTPSSAASQSATASMEEDHQLLVSLMSLNADNRIPGSSPLGSHQIPGPGFAMPTMDPRAAEPRSSLSVPGQTPMASSYDAGIHPAAAERSSVPPSGMAMASPIPPNETPLSTGDEAANMRGNVPPANAAGNNGLFNQLSLLDTADWHGSSSDFMEHLGLSREGSFLDFNSLFSST